MLSEAMKTGDSQGRAAAPPYAFYSAAIAIA